MCKERKRTRDLLLEYDVVPFHHRAGGLSIVYPWENTDVSVFEQQFFKMARDNGYEGTKEEFWKMFSNSGIVPGELNTFPVPGDIKSLYFDVSTGIVYCFKNITTQEELDELVEMGGTVVGKSEDELTTYLYIPIKTLLIENTVLYGGEA